MILVEGKEKEYVLDLNEQPYETHYLKVLSVDYDGNSLSWGVEFISTPVIGVTVDGRDGIRIDLSLEALKKEQYVLLKNYAKERLKIVLKPNLEAVRPKDYKFKITRRIIDGRNVRVRILSKESDNEIPWKCTYNGKPLVYEVSPYDSTESGYVDVILKEDIGCTIETLIRFIQAKSDNVIELRLMQSNDSVEIIKAD